MASSRVLAAGLGVVVLWASAFAAIRVAAPGLGVVGLSFARLAIASAALLVVAPLLKARLPARRHLPQILACGFVGMAAYQVLLNGRAVRSGGHVEHHRGRRAAGQRVDRGGLPR